MAHFFHFVERSCADLYKLTLLPRLPQHGPRPRPPRQRPTARPHPRHRLAVADVAAGARPASAASARSSRSTCRASATPRSTARGRRSRRWRASRPSSSTASGWRAAHVAGNSLGGGVALQLARMGAVRSACALSPAGFVNDREGRYARVAADGVAPRRRGWPTARRGCMARGPVRRTLALLSPRRAPVADPGRRGGGRAAQPRRTRPASRRRSRRSRTSAGPGPSRAAR